MEKIVEPTLIEIETGLKPVVLHSEKDWIKNYMALGGLSKAHKNSGIKFLVGSKSTSIKGSSFTILSLTGNSL